MAESRTSRLVLPKKTRGGGYSRHAAINKILFPLINRVTIYSENENKRAMQIEFEKNGFCFTSNDEFIKHALEPKKKGNTLFVGFTEVLGDINFLSAYENRAAIQPGMSAREITFATRFANVSACYFEHWKDDNENTYLQKIFLHLYYTPDRQSESRQFFAIHSDPDLNNPHPMYNGITHVHVGDGVLSNMHVVTDLMSGGATFESIEASDKSFGLAVKQLCRELEREKFIPFRFP